MAEPPKSLPSNISLRETAPQRQHLPSPGMPGQNVLYLSDLVLIEPGIYRKRGIDIGPRIIELISACLNPGPKPQCSRISGVRR